MGLHARRIVSGLASKVERYLEALKGKKVHMDDDSFAKLVNLQDHIFKCAETYPPPSAIDQVRKEHRRKLSGYILEICSIVAGVIHQETFDKVRQVESTSVGEAKVKSSSKIDKIQAELAAARKLLGDIESSIGDFTKLKTPQSDMRDQRVLECEAPWSFTHNSYTTRFSLIMELVTAGCNGKAGMAH